MRHRNPKLMALERKMGIRWRKARKARGLKHNEIVERLAKKNYFCHKSVINRLENGRSDPVHSQVLIMNMCVIYCMTPNDIFGNEIQFENALRETKRIKQKLKEEKCRKKDS